MADWAVGKANCAPDSQDWDAFVEQVRWHRLGPMVLRHLPADAPSAVRTGLLRQKKQVAFESVRTLKERDAILNALQGAGVEPVVLLKGAVTGWLVYPDPTLRPMADLDVLVDRGQQALVTEGLQSLGYKRIDTHPTRKVSGSRVYEQLFARSLVADTVLQAVDVHTGFAQQSRYPVDYSAVIRRAVGFAQGGPHAYRLDDVDHLLHLAIHMARDQFMGPLRQLLDVHLWVSQQPLSWDIVVARATQWGARSTLFMALQLANTVFETPVPGDVLVALDPGGVRGRFLRWWHRPTEERLIRWDVGIRMAQVMALFPLMDQSLQRARFAGEYAWLRSRDVLGR